MRVTQVVADGRPGGGTVVVLSLLEALIARGVSASVVTDAGSHAATEARRLGATVEEIPFFAIQSASRELRRALRRLEPDVVHAHGSRAGFHTAGWRSRRPSRPVHYTVHGYHFEHRVRPRRWLGRWAERRSARRLSTVIHVCDYDRRLAERLGLLPAGVPRKVIYNGVDPAALPDALPAQPPRVVFAGRLVPQKDPDLVAAIAGRLAEAGIGVTIVGGGPGETGVRRQLAPHLRRGTVEMTGEVDRDRSLEQLARASLLILPSRWEGLPVVLLEALAMGVPAVAAAVGGVPEIVLDGETGRLVAARDPDAFAAVAADLLAAPDLRRKMAAAGRALVAERFTLDRMIDSHLALYGLRER